MTDEQLEKRIQQSKSKRGGARPGSGRKSRMEEHEIIRRLEPMAETAFRILNERLAQGDIKALQIYFSYFIGLPTQKIENKIEGQLNQVSVKVVRPELIEEAILVN